MRKTPPMGLQPITAKEAGTFLRNRKSPLDVVALVPVPARYTVKNLPDRLTGRLRLVSRLFRVRGVDTLIVSLQNLYFSLNSYFNVVVF